MPITPAAIRALAEGNMDNFLAAATPGGIEAQEAAGQATFCAQQILPKEMRDVTREQLEAIGFKFGKDHDDIFVNATLPSGWKKKATDHSMWSNLLDAKGRIRAAIFYKAAFYDRSASMRMERRYSVCSYEDSVRDKEYYEVVVKDGGVKLRSFGEYPSRDYEHAQMLEKEAASWLLATFPEHSDAFAYWD